MPRGVRLYEGHSARDVAAGVRFLAQGGVERLILIDAAGSVRPDFVPGSRMMITDHLNLTGSTLLLGTTECIDLTDACRAWWRERFATAAEPKTLPLHQGVYAGVLGPEYETVGKSRPAMNARRGRNRHVNCLRNHPSAHPRARSGRFSCLTNWTAWLNSSPLSRADVLPHGEAIRADFASMLAAALGCIAV